ncbi:MAG TPA: FixH family protein [Burkholderiaceae bacterium]|nr:FixH family protein [Burkholderiaceae bacterium]
MASPAPPASTARSEPLVWLIVGIPALTIVAGIVTFWIAAQRADSNVAADYYKRGLTVNRILEREERAAQRSLAAEVDLARGELAVTLKGPTALAPSSLRVTLTHPVRSELDVRLVLARSADGSYRGAMPSIAGERWHLSIEADDWRLSSRSVSLRPGARVRVPEPR